MSRSRRRTAPASFSASSLGKETGVFCKLSGLLTEAGTRTNAEALKPYVDVILDAFGPP